MEHTQFERMKIEHYEELAREVHENLDGLGFSFGRLEDDRQRLFNYAVFAISNDWGLVTELAVPESLVDKDFLIMKLRQFKEHCENDPDFSPEWYDKC